MLPQKSLNYNYVIRLPHNLIQDSQDKNNNLLAMPKQNPKQTKVLLSTLEHLNHIYLYWGTVLQGFPLKRGVETV